MIEERVRDYFEEHCISIRGLIDKAGLGRSFTRFINGTGSLKKDDLMAICSVLHIQPEEIIGG